ncbi:MAG: hypothetical protein QNJ94_10775 [Alphaproteobacteria bacterium]|nr:hypothetical protein [Alphaproteobacteria bacterium]
MAWLVIIVIVLLVVGVAIRRNYGNVYAALAPHIEKFVGLRMDQILKGLGLATLIIWLIVFLSVGEEDRPGLDQIFKGLFNRGEEAE